MNYKTIPVVASFPTKNHPGIPSGLKVMCMCEPSTLKSSSNCPIVAWDEYIYWAYSYHDNRFGMCIVAYKEDGTFVKRWDMKGARYVYKITNDEKTETLTFWGQADKKIVMKWSDLYLTIPPEAGEVPAKVHPPIPNGLKLACMKCADKLELSGNCFVIEWGNYTYWAYGYIDNRESMCIVAYDVEGKVVEKWEKSGSRYHYKITVDASAQTVTFWGQSDSKIVMKWSELKI